MEADKISFIAIAAIVAIVAVVGLLGNEQAQKTQHMTPQTQPMMEQPQNQVGNFGWSGAIANRDGLNRQADARGAQTTPGSGNPGSTDW